MQQGGNVVPPDRAADAGRAATKLGGERATPPGEARAARIEGSVEVGRRAATLRTQAQTRDARKLAVEADGRQKNHQLTAKLDTRTSPKTEARAEQRADRAEQRAETRADARAQRTEARADTKAERTETRTEARADRAEAKDTRNADRIEARAERSADKVEARAERRADDGEARAESRTEFKGDDDGRTELRTESRSEFRTGRGDEKTDFRSERRGDDGESRSPRGTDTDSNDGDALRTRGRVEVESDDDGAGFRANARAESGGGDDGGSFRTRGRGESGDDGGPPRSEFRAEHSRGRGDDDGDGRSRFESRSEFRADGYARGRGDDGPPGNAYGLRRGRGDDGPDLDFNLSRRPDERHSHGRNGHGDNFAVLDLDGGVGSLAASVRGLLHALKQGEDVPPGLRRALESAPAGEELLRLLGEGRAADKVLDKSFRILERALEHAYRTLERSADGGRQFVGNGRHAAGEVVEELLHAAHLNRYLKQLERVGGQPVRQAEEVIARVLYAQTRDGGDYGRGVGTLNDRPSAAELLRDLRAGAFFPPQEARSPFPLTGRARVVTEMMELMRTLDAYERVMRSVREGAAQVARSQSNEAPGAILKAHLAGGLEALDELLASLFPTLPGRAGRNEIPRLAAALEGMLKDAQGRLLVFTKDGVPLKLDQLLWLGTAGGLLGSSFEAELTPSRLSPLLVYGFDAVYSLIGFDGRTLAQPHFAALQAEINGSELEWMFGQQPLTEGWLRALIERLKDSAFAEHNLFGETLEEALTEGRFHAALIGGTVAEGAAEPETFGVTKLLPGATCEAAFA